jgi:BirA family transcriptional regulator, biotin operon repressor / biotin---[acetyl-CoA-carboxylase] ligase
VSTTLSPCRLDWPCLSLQARLQDLLPGLRVEAAARVGSTSTCLVDRWRQGDPTPTLLVAEDQTQGRGRNGRPWQSAPGASLTFSLSVPLQPVDWSGLSLAVGVALADTIDPPQAAGSPRLWLKWPNDLWLADGPDATPRWRKLGGILIETVGGAGTRACVVGVGLNVQPRALLPAPVGSGHAAQADPLSSGYACVQELDAASTAPSLLATVAEPLLRALLRFEREGLSPFAQAFTRRDLLLGQPVTTTLAAVSVGRAEGIDAQGALRVRQHDQLHTVSSGEVSVRPAAPSDGMSVAPSAVRSIGEEA